MTRNQTRPPLSVAALVMAASLFGGSSVLAQTPDQTACGAVYGRGYTGQQQIDACTRLIQGGQLQSSDLAMAYQLRGKARAMSGDKVAAVADYGEAIRLQPVYPLAFYNRGTALNDLQRYDEAVADFTRAIAQQPGYAWAYLNRGNSGIFSGRLQQAIADYSEAIRLDPSLREAWNNRGVARRRLGDTAGADADRAEAVRLATP